jgi:hypothetical protein
MEDFLIEARKLAYGEVERTGMPVKAHVDLATEMGKKLAPELGANINIIEAGTLLMDCAIGQALKEKRLADHVQMSLAMANILLEKSSLNDETKENIRHCILEHHGTDKFYSLESEIVCNADCFRFTSIKGFSFALRYMRDMPFNELINLLRDKVEEKWNAISLSIVKQELAPEHEMLLNFLNNLPK